MACHIFQSKLNWRSKSTLILFLFCCQIGFSGVGRFTWCQGSGPAPSPAPSPSLCPMWMQLMKWLRGAQPTSLKVSWRSRKERSGRVQDTVCLEHPELSMFISDRGAVPAFPAPQIGGETSLYSVVRGTAVRVTIKPFPEPKVPSGEARWKASVWKVETCSLPRPASFLYLLYTLIKHYYTKLWAIKPCVWSWIEFFSSGGQESRPSFHSATTFHKYFKKCRSLCNRHKDGLLGK